MVVGSNGKAIGYDIDIVQAMARRVSVGVETVSLSSAERIPMLNEDKVDLVATSMTRTPERLKEVDFSLYSREDRERQAREDHEDDAAQDGYVDDMDE